MYRSVKVVTRPLVDGALITGEARESLSLFVNVWAHIPTRTGGSKCGKIVVVAAVVIAVVIVLLLAIQVVENWSPMPAPVP